MSRWVHVTAPPVYHDLNVRCHSLTSYLCTGILYCTRHSTLCFSKLPYHPDQYVMRRFYIYRWFSHHFHFSSLGACYPRGDTLQSFIRGGSTPLGQAPYFVVYHFDRKDIPLSYTIYWSHTCLRILHPHRLNPWNREVNENLQENIKR